MEKRMLTPAEIAESTILTGVKKANSPSLQLLLLGILAGAFIGFGSHADIVIMQTMGKIDVGLAKFLGAAVFPVGLMLVIIAGGELFTGNNLMTLALIDKKIGIKGLLRNWGLVYFGNFIGAVALAYSLNVAGFYNSETVANMALKIATGKMGLTFGSAFIRGTLANIVVALAVWLSYSSKDIVGKIFAIWFPIMMFVLSGFEHSIANMFFLPIVKFIGAGEFTWIEMWTNNLIPVTLGNVFGGGVIIPVMYYLIYIAPSRKYNKGKEVPIK